MTRRSALASTGGRSWRHVVAGQAGRAASALSRRLGLGAGSVVGGRVAVALAPDLLEHLAAGRTSIIVTGTNGKTTTSHLVAATLAERGPVAHNADGSNMRDGVVAAFLSSPQARVAVLEVDELHLRAVAPAVRPDVLVLLNLSRDQLDRVGEVRMTARSIRALVAELPDTTVVANLDDPLVAWATEPAARRVGVTTGTRWRADAPDCPVCGQTVAVPAAGSRWSCPECGHGPPPPDWEWDADAGVVRRARGDPVPVHPALPGRINGGNAAMALAAAAEVGVDPCAGAEALRCVAEVSGRYAVVEHRGRQARLLLVKNPAGWAETVEVLAPDRPLVVAVNAREADGHDVSWLWDLPVEVLQGQRVVAAGDRAADLGVRLSYDEIDHETVPDPVAALAALPTGPVDVVANYTALRGLRRELRREPRREPRRHVTSGDDGRDRGH